MTAARIDVGRIVERYAAGENEAHAAIRSTGDVVRAVLDQLGPGPKVRRERTDLDHVNTLVESGGASWPPIVVTGITGTIIDGHHRAAAARRLGWSTIPAVVLDIDHRSSEGLAAAAKANIGHGLSLSLPERKSIAGKLIAETDWSDNRIGDVCGLSGTTVLRLRPKRATSAPEEVARRAGRDGKVRPAPVEAARRREAAAKELSEKPTASDREVAKRTGLSPRTVAKVRQENAGEDPAPPRLRAVPDPDPEPPKSADEPPKVAVGDVVTLVPTRWAQEKACQATNATREFGRFMDRFTRWNGKSFEHWARRLADDCPVELRKEAAEQARWMADWWRQVQERFEGEPRIGGM